MYKNRGEDYIHNVVCDISLNNDLYAEIDQVHIYENQTNLKALIKFQLNFIYSQKVYKFKNLSYSYLG